MRFTTTQGNQMRSTIPGLNFKSSKKADGMGYC